MVAHKVSSLDALRGLLSLVVVAAHAWQVFYQPAASNEALHLLFGLSARVAVLAFFCLSGYVITLSLQANRDRGFSALEYATARVFRIAPPLAAVVLLTVAAQATLAALSAGQIPKSPLLPETFSTDAATQWLALASVGTAGELTGWLNWPLWSLIIEIRLYVVAGLLAVMAWSPRPWKALAAVGLLAYVVAIDLPVLDPPLSTWRPHFNRQALCFVAFGLGSLAYRLREASPRAVLAVAAAALAGAWALSVPAQSIIAHLDSQRMNAAQAVLSVALACAVLLVGRTRFAFLDAGRYSYTLYIGHFPLLLALYFLAWHFAPALLAARWAPLTAAAAMGVAWASLAALGRWVERPREQRAFCRSVLTRSLRLAR